MGLRRWRRPACGSFDLAPGNTRRRVALRALEYRRLELRSLAGRYQCLCGALCSGFDCLCNNKAINSPDRKNAAADWSVVWNVLPYRGIGLFYPLLHLRAADGLDRWCPQVRLSDLLSDCSMDVAVCVVSWSTHPESADSISISSRCSNCLLGSRLERSERSYADLGNIRPDLTLAAGAANAEADEGRQDRDVDDV